MSKEYMLTAEIRVDQGKGASRRLRRTGGVPAIVYGANQDPVSVTLKHNELIRQLQDESFYSQLITLQLEGKEQTVVLRDLQRHPAKPTILHADLQRVQADHLIRVTVPLHFINAETSVGVKTQGGTVSHIMSNVELSCLPKDIPTFIEVDLQTVEKGQILHMSDLILPENVTIPQLALGEDYNQAIASIH